jgi:hypothetical protein
MTNWTWRPDWSAPIVERLEWLTDVLATQSAIEQRLRLRGGARRGLEFSLVTWAQARRSFEASLFAHQSGDWLLPIWPDGQQLSAALPDGSAIIPLDTTTRDYVAGGTVMLIQGDNVETATIATVAAGQLNLSGVTTLAFSAGAWVYPARLARMMDGQPFARLTDDHLRATVQMRQVDPAIFTGSTPTTYRGLPVFTQRPNWVSDPGAEYRRQIDQIDYAVGLIYEDDRTGRPEIIQTHDYLLSGRSEIAAFRALLYALSGRQGTFWLPTWASDVQVTAAVGASDTTLDIEAMGYVANLAQAINRRDIRIQLASGVVLYRRITHSVGVNSSTERLTLDAALGVAVQPAEIIKVSWLQVARLEADAVEFSWQTDALVDVALPLRVVTHDV